MRGEEHGGIVLQGELAHQQENIVAGFRIEISGGFVGNDDLRFVEQCPRDDDALLLASGELVRHFIKLIQQIDLLQYFLNALANFRLIAPAGRIQYKLKIFAYAAIGQQVKILKNDTQLAAQVRNGAAIQLCQIKPGDFAFAGGQRQGSIQCFQQARLPASRLPDEIGELPTCDFQVHISQHQIILLVNIDLLELHNKILHKQSQSFKLAKNSDIFGIQSIFGMRHLIILFLCSFLMVPLLAQSTKLVVRAKAKDAKFIGSSVGGAMILVRNADTGEILAQGLTSGSTGNTNLIMSTPQERHTRLADERTAKFETELELTEPTFVTIEAHAPYTKPGNRVAASTQAWLIPGRDMVGDGVILEIPGFVVDILNPRTYQVLSIRDLDSGFLTVQANIVMMCGCAISDGGLWDGSKMKVRAIIKRDGQKLGEYPLLITETANLFEGRIPMTEPGNHEIIVYAFDPRTNNTGVAKVNFALN